jgi:hypothetical protein
MVRLLAKVIGIGIETADMLVQEILSRNLRDRRAVARYAMSRRSLYGAFFVKGGAHHFFAPLFVHSITDKN